MHGHMAFWGAYAMLILAIITYAMPLLSGRKLYDTPSATVAFWASNIGMIAMTLAFGEAGAAQNFKYAGSDKLKEVGWFEQNSHKETKPIGLKMPNRLGLHDMSGNVWEWCEDDWHDSYKNAPNDGNAWVDAPERSLYRVYRGGNWDYAPLNCRVAFRNCWPPELRFNLLGFRLCLAPSS